MLVVLCSRALPTHGALVFSGILVGSITFTVVEMLAARVHVDGVLWFELHHADRANGVVVLDQDLHDVRGQDKDALSVAHLIKHGDGKSSVFLRQELGLPLLF